MDAYNSNKNFIYDLIATVTFLSTYYVMMPVFSTAMLQKGIDKLTIGFIISFFSVSSLVARPLGGTWVDILGRRKLMLISVGLFFLTPLLLKLPYLTVGFGMAQLIYGFTIGAFTVAATTFVADISTPQNVAQFMGFHSVACIIAKGMAPAIGIKLMKIYGFNGTITFTVVLAIIALMFVLFLKDIKLDRKQSRSYGFIELILKKDIYLPTMVLFCGLVTFGAISSILPVFAAERNISGIEYFFIINTLAVVLARLLIGRWSGRHLGTLTALSLIFLTMSFVAMSFVYKFYQLIVVAIIYGLGYAILFPTLSAILVIHISNEYRGMALGIFTAAFDLGVSVGAMFGGMSQFISFKWLYLILSFIPLTGFLVFQYIYIPLLEKEKETEMPA